MLLPQAETSQLQISNPPWWGKFKFKGVSHQYSGSWGFIVMMSAMFQSYLWPFLFTWGDERHLNGIVPLQILYKDELFSHNQGFVHYSALPVLVVLSDQIQFMVNKVSENFLKFTVIEGLILSSLWFCLIVYSNFSIVAIFWLVFTRTWLLKGMINYSSGCENKENCSAF